MDLGRAHLVERRRKHHSVSLAVESSREEKERETTNHLAQEVKKSGHSWHTIVRERQDRQSGRERFFMACAPPCLQPVPLFVLLTFHICSLKQQ